MGNFYTVQTLEVAQELIKTGRYVCDPSKSVLIQENGFKKAYDWMVNQMISRIGPPPEGVNYPVWAFLDTDEDWANVSGMPGDVMVRIDFTIDDSHVVASDFDEWNCVLLEYSIGDSDTESSEWQGIFREAHFDEDCQFTLWELRIEDVTSITPFIVPECED